MCGRFTQLSSRDRLAERFGAVAEPPVDLGPRYNVAPGQPVAAVRGGDGERRVAILR